MSTIRIPRQADTRAHVFEPAEGPRPVSAKPNDEQREVARLARGVLAGVRLRLLAGAVDATYSPTEVATIVSEVLDEQIARLEAAD